MQVRFSGYYYVCECAHAMRFLDPIQEVARRRLLCDNPNCPHKDVLYLEPLFLLEKAIVND